MQRRTLLKIVAVSACDRRYGHAITGAKMTEVRGHSRGMIAPLQAAGRPSHTCGRRSFRLVQQYLGTNYPQGCGGDWLARFSLSV
jgi:hypothetical protein